LRMRFLRRRLPQNVGIGATASPELVNTISPSKYPIITTEYILKNEDMVEFDTWEPNAVCGTGYKEFDISGNKSIFEVDLLEVEMVDSAVADTKVLFTPKTWAGGVSINPNTGIVTVTKGNSTTTPGVNPQQVTPHTPKNGVYTAVNVDSNGVEQIPNAVTRTITIGNITVPDGYSNAGEKLSLTKDVNSNYLSDNYYDTLIGTIKKMKDEKAKETTDFLAIYVASVKYKADNLTGRNAVTADENVNKNRVYLTSLENHLNKLIDNLAVATAKVAKIKSLRTNAPSGISAGSKYANTGGKIICNELYRQGYLSEQMWDADERYGEMMFETDPKLVIGYQMWARSVVKYMRKNPNNTKFAYWLFKSWTEYMGYKMGVVEKPTLRGKFTNWIGTQFSYMVFDLYNGKRLLDKYNYKLFKLDIDGNR